MLFNSLTTYDSQQMQFILFAIVAAAAGHAAAGTLSARQSACLCFFQGTVSVGGLPPVMETLTPGCDACTGFPTCGAPTDVTNVPIAGLGTVTGSIAVRSVNSLQPNCH